MDGAVHIADSIILDIATGIKITHDVCSGIIHEIALIDAQHIQEGVVSIRAKFLLLGRCCSQHLQEMFGTSGGSRLRQGVQAFPRVSADVDASASITSLFCKDTDRDYEHEGLHIIKNGLVTLSGEVSVGTTIFSGLCGTLVHECQTIAGKYSSFGVKVDHVYRVASGCLSHGLVKMKQSFYNRFYKAAIYEGYVKTDGSVQIDGSGSVQSEGSGSVQVRDSGSVQVGGPGSGQIGGSINYGLQSDLSVLVEKGVSISRDNVHRIGAAYHVSDNVCGEAFYELSLVKVDYYNSCKSIAAKYGFQVDVAVANATSYKKFVDPKNSYYGQFDHYNQILKKQCFSSNCGLCVGFSATDLTAISASGVKAMAASAFMFFKYASLL